MKKNPCDIVAPGDWLSINGRDYDVYEVQFLFAFFFDIANNEMNKAVCILSHSLLFFFAD